MMEATLKPYPEYQDTGHDWLGQVPAHWAVLPNGALFREVKDQNHPEEPLLSVTIARGVIFQLAHVVEGPDCPAPDERGLMEHAVGGDVGGAGVNMNHLSL